MKRILGVFLFVLVLSVNGHAQNQADSVKVAFSCNKESSPISKFFPEIQAAALKLDRAVCAAIQVPTRNSVVDGFPREDVTAFGALVKKNVSAKFAGVGLKNLKEQLDYFASTLSSGDRYPQAMPRLNAEKGMDPRAPEPSYYFTDSKVTDRIVLTPADDKKCQADAALKKPCKEVLAQLDQDILPYQRNATAFTAYGTRVQLNALAEEWNAYFEGTRAQTFADIAITTVLEKRHFKQGYLVGPPVRQWFVLHPNVAMELVEGAPDGENLTSAFYIEWFGVNWWRDSIIGIPFGISLSSIYSDRPEVDDVGHGVTLHLDNKYVIGYANHGGEDGFYISLDLLKLVENKQDQANRYRDKVKAILE